MQPYQQGYAQPVMQYGQQGYGQYQQPQFWQQQPQQQAAKVDGPAEAMNRFLMRYQANQLVPGFISDPLFDVNGRQFHTLSIESDGRRNLETFDYELHVEPQPTEIDSSQFVSRSEFNQVMAQISERLEALNGVHESISGTGPSGKHTA